MKKVIGFGRRFLACIMIVFTLSFTTAGNYLGIQEMQVYATGAGTMVLRALIEAILLSLGLSCSSTADIDSLATGFQALINNHKLTSPEDERWSFWAGVATDAQLGTTVTVSGSSYMLLKNYVWNQIYNSKSSASDVQNPFINEIGYESITCDFSGMDVLCANGLFYGLSDWPEYLIPATGIDKAPVIISELVQGDGRAEINLYYTYSTSGNSFAVFNNNTYQVINGSDTNVGFVWLVNKCFYDYGTERVSISQTVSGSGIRRQKSEYVLDETGAKTGKLVIDESGGKKYKVFVNSSQLGIYDSISSYNDKQFASIYAPKSTVYGLSHSAKDFEVDASGNVSIPLSETSITQAVENAVNSAIAANPSITEEELNSAVADLIASNNGIEDSVNNNTTTLGTLLTSILAVVRGVAADVKTIANKAITEGSSALQLDDIAEQFSVIEGGALEPEEPEPEEPEPEEPKLWKYTPVGFEFVKFLEPVFEFFAEPLEIVTASLRQIWTSIEAVPGNISSTFSEWVLPQLENLTKGVDNIFTSITGLPDKIAAAISTTGIPLEVPEIKVPEIKVPEITMPEPIDYTNPLNRIIQLLESFFVIDTAALAASCARADTIWKDKLPFGDAISKLYDGLNFSDDYVYPVIKMKTPDVLKNFYASDEIILLDFADYSQYVLWARNIVKAWLWFCFGLSIFNHLKTNFHVG